MSTQAAYDQATYAQLTNWRDTERIGNPALPPTSTVETSQVNARESQEIDQVLVDLLGIGTGPVLELGYPPRTQSTCLAELGWSPIGMDLSGRASSQIAGQVPIARTDGGRLPIASNSLRAVAAVMVHSSIGISPGPDYREILAEMFRVLRPGGVFVHIGAHPCYSGDFVDQRDDDMIIIRPGYLDNGSPKTVWADRNSRSIAGARHLPLSSLLNTVATTGLVIDKFSESGRPTPRLLSFRASKPAVPFIG